MPLHPTKGACACQLRSPRRTRSPDGLERDHVGEILRSPGGPLVREEVTKQRYFGMFFS